MPRSIRVLSIAPAGIVTEKGTSSKICKSLERNYIIIWSYTFKNTVIQLIYYTEWRLWMTTNRIGQKMRKPGLFSLLRSKKGNLPTILDHPQSQIKIERSGLNKYDYWFLKLKTAKKARSLKY